MKSSSSDVIASLTTESKPAEDQDASDDGSTISCLSPAIRAAIAAAAAATAGGGGSGITAGMGVGNSGRLIAGGLSRSSGKFRLASNGTTGGGLASVVEQDSDEEQETAGDWTPPPRRRSVRQLI
jgi:hypothetical protein